MKYGIVKVVDSGSRGSPNTGQWANRKGTKTRAEFDSDAEARAYIRDVILPERGIAAEMSRMRARGLTTRSGPARHEIYYAWPLPAAEGPDQEEPQDSPPLSGQDQEPSSLPADSRADGEPTLL